MNTKLIITGLTVAVILGGIAYIGKRSFLSETIVDNNNNVNTTIPAKNDTPATPSQGSEMDIPYEVTLQGALTCLPHKGVNPDAPQTMECAYGLKVMQDGKPVYYSLDTHLLTPEQSLLKYQGDVMVTGILTPVEMLNSIQKYDITGIVTVRTIAETK